MPLWRLYNLTTPSANPSGMTGLLPGGAGVQVAGSTANPGISAPRIEESVIEVLDITAPTLLAAAGTANAGLQVGLPAPAGKLLVLSPLDSIGGAKWKLSSIYQQAIPRGQAGVVFTPGTTTGTPPDTGYAFQGASGPQTSGTKAVVMFNGPINAFVTTVRNTTAISAGMYLTPDGAGNLTYAGASPAAGTVVATALGPVASNVSVPVQIPVYVGNF
jgi:hypothetical protein